MFKLFRNKNSRLKELEDFSFHRIEYTGLKTIPYTIFAEFSNFKIELDRRLERIFKGDIDAGNINVLDNLIEDISRIAIQDLNRQYDDHQENIDALAARAIEDQLILESMIKNEEYQLNEIEEELKELEEKSKRYKSE